MELSGFEGWNKVDGQRMCLKLKDDLKTVLCIFLFIAWKREISSASLVINKMKIKTTPILMAIIKMILISIGEKVEKLKLLA